MSFKVSYQRYKTSLEKVVALHLAFHGLQIPSMRKIQYYTKWSLDILFGAHAIKSLIYPKKMRGELAMALIEVENLKVYFPIRGGIFSTIQDFVRAVDGVSLSIEEGQTYGLVGESGSGKTTTGRAIIGLNKITSGDVI